MRNAGYYLSGKSGLPLNVTNSKEYYEKHKERIDRTSIINGKAKYNFDVSGQLHDIYKYHFSKAANKEEIYFKLIERCEGEVSDYKKGVEVFTTETLLLKKLEIEAARGYGVLTLFFIILGAVLLIKSKKIYLFLKNGK